MAFQKRILKSAYFSNLVYEESCLQKKTHTQKHKTKTSTPPITKWGGTFKPFSAKPEFIRLPNLRHF